MSARHAVFYCVMFAAAAVAVAVGVTYGRAGYWQVGFVPILISPMAMVLLRAFMEPAAQMPGIMNLNTQSWAFLFGDLIGLPIALGASALAWQRIDAAWPFTSWWFAASVALGVAIGLVFRFLVNAPGYTGDDASRMLSPTSLWHDFVVYIVCATLLIYLGAPALAHDFSGFGWVALLGFAFWLAMGACDATIHRLEPANLHPKVEDTVLRH